MFCFIINSCIDFPSFLINSNRRCVALSFLSLIEDVFAIYEVFLRFPYLLMKSFPFDSEDFSIVLLICDCFDFVFIHLEFKTWFMDCFRREFIIFFWYYKHLWLDVFWLSLTIPILYPKDRYAFLFWTGSIIDVPDSG